MVWTMRANLQGPTGPAGDDGREVELRTSGANIEWRYSGETAWTILVPLATITGPRGEDGTSVNIEGSVADAAALPTTLTAADAGSGYITQNDGHLHVWDGDSFNDVGLVRGPQGEQGIPGEDGANGRSVELRNTGSAIEWRQEGGTWTLLSTLAAITGPAGPAGQEVSLQTTATHVQWRLGTGAWADLIPLSALTGPQGPAGNDGAEVSLQTSATHVQWRLGTGSWVDLIALSALKGEKGDAGLRGTQWFNGIGAPGTIPGAAPGDYYLDNASGTVYILE